MKAARSEHWGLAAIVVSLDLVDPYLAPMGLGDLDPKILRASTREAIEKMREPWQPPPRETWLDTIETSMGGEARSAIERWTLMVFEITPADHQEWIAWQSVFLMIGGRRETFDRLGFVEPGATALWEKYKRIRDTHDVDELGARTRGKPLTDWDLEACALNGLFPDEEDSLFSNWLRAAIRNHRFQTFFWEVQARLDEGALVRLWRRGKEIRVEHHADPARLVDPRRLTPAGLLDPIDGRLA